jgi:proline iminopeptidase
MTLKQLIFAAILQLFFMACKQKDLASPGLLVPRTVDQDLSLPSLAIKGTLLHVESFGNPTDPMIVIIHGGPGADYRSMLSAKEFIQNGYFVVFYDQRGSGLSKRESKSQYEDRNAVQLFIDDLDAIIDHFHVAESQKVFLAGHSWGAMLATGYVNQHPNKISGLILAEPGGFTWKQTEQYLSRSNHIKFFSEALNNAIFPEQIFAGRDEQEVLDYKASYFSAFENAPGNTIGNASSYPFWRNGSVAFNALIDNADKNGFDFTTQLNRFPTKVLFLYSEFNTAYQLDWAKTVSAPYPNVDIQLIKGTGHEMYYFGWNNLYPIALTYLNELK